MYGSVRGTAGNGGPYRDQLSQRHGGNDGGASLMRILSAGRDMIGSKGASHVGLQVGV